MYMYNVCASTAIPSGEDQLFTEISGALSVDTLRGTGVGSSIRMLLVSLGVTGDNSSELKLSKLLNWCRAIWRARCAHPPKSGTQHCQCLLLCLWMLCLCCGICRLWLVAVHGNIMDVLEEKKNFFVICSQRYESFPSSKTAYSYLLK